MSIATQIELTLYRSKLLRADFANGAFQDACKIAARHVARLERIRLTECNGIAVYQGHNKPTVARGLTDAEQALADKQVSQNQAAVAATLRPFLTPGCAFKFYADPRACVARISNKANTRDAFLNA